MKKLSLLFFLFLFIINGAFAQSYYWVGFTDKKNTTYSLDNPGDYLSERAIQRRNNQNIDIDSLDLPVNQLYIDSVLTLEVNLIHASKWLNGITVSADTTGLVDSIINWSFIKEIQLTKPDLTNKSISVFNKFTEEAETTDYEPIDTSVYGNSVYQIGMLNGQYLHNDGYYGQEMQIAVLDAGFYRANEYDAFDSLWTNNQILGTKDFVSPNSDFFNQNDHGMSVLSCMGGNIPGKLIGTAPKASYLLLRTEDGDSEYIIEEDNWVAAAEFADSVGVDIINSSLGYYEFNDASTNHIPADMDGKTTRVTRGANIAASRGILVFSSAGNQDYATWKRISAPADGDKVVAVGSVTKNLNHSYFSSVGPSYDGDIKPNVVAMGSNTVLQLLNGYIGISNGTSFSSPVMAGIAASLWCKYPSKTASEIKDAIERSASQYNNPDSLLGYGIPDMKAASELLSANTAAGIIQKNNKWTVFPNPVTNFLILQHQGTDIKKEITIRLYTIDGRNIREWKYSNYSNIVLNNWSDISNGIYLLQICSTDNSETYKICKKK